MIQQVEEITHGFSRFIFEDLAKNKCSIQESLEEQTLRFGVEIDFGGNETTRMHLNRIQAAELLPYLRTFVETGKLPS